MRKRPYLQPYDETIAHVLGAAGYTTCQIGKWHAGEPGTPGMPHLQGFTESLCFDHGDKKRSPSCDGNTNNRSFFTMHRH